MRAMFAVLVIGLMAFMLLAGRDRSIDLPNSLVDNHRLRILDAEEAQNLRRFLAALLTSSNISVEVAINERYKSGHINLYIVDARTAEGQASVSRGNAAYVSSSDIIFVERIKKSSPTRTIL